jgi:predicted nucleic acid-binding protein
VTNFTVDTNILIYSVDPTETTKHNISKRLMAQAYLQGGPLPLQCLAEFYAACTKKRHLASAGKVAEVVHRAMESMRIINSSSEDVLDAIHNHQQHNIQFFDALLIATARRAGCHTFFTEDMQDGRTLKGINLCNPFLLSAEELDGLLT